MYNCSAKNRNIQQKDLSPYVASENSLSIGYLLLNTFRRNLGVNSGS